MAWNANQKIGKDDKRHVEKLFKERVKYSLIIASSIEDQKNMSTAFNVIIDNYQLFRKGSIMKLAMLLPSKNNDTLK